MDWLALILISISLAMDAFAVSLASGFSHPKFTFPKALRMAVFFGGFQAGMPLIGWYGGTHIQKLIAPLDHWVAFILLAFIGGHMIFNALTDYDQSPKLDPFNLKILTGLAIATSIDALVVGISLALIKTPILMTVTMIGVVTFSLSIVGIYLGRKSGHLFGAKFEIFGGLILIGLGLKILIEHLSA